MQTDCITKILDWDVVTFIKTEIMWGLMSTNATFPTTLNFWVACTSEVVQICFPHPTFVNNRQIPFTLLLVLPSLLGVLLMLSFWTLLWSYNTCRLLGTTNDAEITPTILFYSQNFSVSRPFQDEAQRIIINVAPGSSFVLTRKCQRLNVEEAVVAGGWEQSCHWFNTGHMLYKFTL